MPDPYVLSLGRISGALLSPNLQRRGLVETADQNLSFNTDLLYIDVVNSRIGVKTSTPSYTLDINSDVRTTNLEATARADIANVRIDAPNTFKTITGALHIYADGARDPVLFHDRLTTSALELDGNNISSYNNQNIVLDPNGTGIIDIYANTYMTGNLAVSGNITMNGDLRSAGTVIIGDQPLDTVTISPDFTQSIIPGDDNAYVLGADAGDSSPRRWSELHSPDWTHVGTLRPDTMTVSGQMFIDGVNNKISETVSNADVELLPANGITRIEQTQWQNSDITNLDGNTPLSFSSTGTGYLKFVGNNAMIIPAGTNFQRPSEQGLTPELGDTRWNTEAGYLECWNGTIYVQASGGGEVINKANMEYLGFIWNLALG
jgi:hypothetical protein